MKRRKFVLASGSTVLSSFAMSNLKQPAVGLEFEISSVEDAKPSNSNKLLLDFTKLKLIPHYFNSQKEIDVIIEIDVDDKNPVVKKAKNVGFSNGEVLSASDIEKRSGVSISRNVLDVSSLTGSTIQGSVSIKVDHPDISKKSYNEYFSINKGITVIDDFEDVGISDYSRDDDGISPTWQTQSGTVFNGSSALECDINSERGTTSLVSTSGLNAYHNRGETIRIGIYHDNVGDAATFYNFGSDGTFIDSHGAQYRPVPKGYSIQISPQSTGPGSVSNLNISR